jgi:predicted permease
MSLMQMMSALRARVRAIVRRGTVDREMRDEMALHLEQATERLMRRGLNEAEARDAARREFGNVAVLQEEGRDVRGGRWIEMLVSDVRFAMRHFSRTPLTAITLILVLALGIGVNSALFSLVQVLTMRPAPGVPADDALVRIRGTSLTRSEGKLEGRHLSMPEVNDLATRRETFAAVASYSSEEVMLDLGDGSDPKAMTGHFVSPNFFATLGIRTALGPGLPAGQTDDAPGAELVVVIAHSLWEQIGGDTAIIGRVVRVNDVPVRIVGVAPPAFQGAAFDSGMPLLFLPMPARAAILQSTPHALVSPDSTFLDVFARLAPNATLEQGNAVVKVVATAWVPGKVEPGEPAVISSDVVPLRGLTDVGSDSERLAIVALMGTGALLILLVACTNVSALLVGAAVARRREIAIRLSLGASRLRVIRQLVTETSLIALAGGALGLTLYWWITRLIAWAFLDGGIGPDLGTVGFTAFVALGTGIIFGLSPALHATRLDVSSALKDAGGGTTSRSRLQRFFIVAQIVLTQPLLVAIAMVVGIVLSELGGRVDNPLTTNIVRVEFGTYGGVGSREQKLARIADVMQAVSRLPSVETVVPQSRGFDVADVRVHTADRGAGPRAQETVRAHIEGTAPGYFAFQDIPMRRGRELIASDTAGREMAIVIDSDLARSFWGAGDPIGRRLEMTSLRDRKGTILTPVERGRVDAVGPRTGVVVGVFDTTGAPLRGAGRIYTAAGAQWSKDTYLIRTRGNGTAVIPTIRQLVRTTIPDIPIYGNGLATLEQLDRIERRDVLQLSAGATGAGLLALVLASIGLYGVVALSVRQRHREIGVRVALGARPRQVIRLFFMSGVRLSALGVILGLPLSVVALNLIATSFADVVPLNMPLVGVAIAVVVIAVAALASWIPARRAARVDPLVAIRFD